VLTGSGDLAGTGNSLANAITGNSGANVLDGGSGTDTMAGGAGNDTYVVDDAGDLVVERPGEGSDIVQASISYALGADVESLVLMGTGHLSGTGNALANSITGNSGSNRIDAGGGNDTVSAGAGNDTVFGGGGNDDLAGGLGDDRLDGQDGADTLDGGDGNDFLNGGADADLIFGGAGNDTFFGGGGNDRLFGGDGIDHLFGDGGNDIIRGGRGSDVMTGGEKQAIGPKGADTFVWAREDVVGTDGLAAGLDRITDFASGDKLDFTELLGRPGAAALAALVRVLDTSAGTLVSVDVGKGQFVDVVMLENVHGLSAGTLVSDYMILT